MTALHPRRLIYHSLRLTAHSLTSVISTPAELPGGAASCLPHRWGAPSALSPLPIHSLPPTGASLSTAAVLRLVAVAPVGAPQMLRSVVNTGIETLVP